MSNQFPEKDHETINNKVNEGPQFENISTFEILNVKELRDLTRGESKPILISKQKVTFVKTQKKVARYTRTTIKIRCICTTKFLEFSGPIRFIAKLMFILK